MEFILMDIKAWNVFNKSIKTILDVAIKVAHFVVKLWLVEMRYVHMKHL